MKIPFTKAHGAKNDFLLTWEHEAPEGDRAALARAICERHTGIGADGWMLVAKPTDGAAEGTIQLYNSDGSTAEISGLRLLQRSGLAFEFEMNMGRPEILAERFQLELSGGERDVTLLNVGNPQCAMPVHDFDFDWRAMGAEIESHPHFPRRTNVSFLKPVDEHTIDVRFYERGAGETMSSGTGSTGAAVTAVLRGMARSPVRVLTPAGPIDLRLNEDVYLTGPAEIIADGEFF